MKPKTKTLYDAIFPNISKKTLNKFHSNGDVIYYDFFKEFRNTGYVRKINSIQISSKNKLRLSNSTLYTKDDRKNIPCRERDIFLISDYFTDEHFKFQNRFILIQFDFSTPSKYRVLYTKEYPLNDLTIPELESLMAYIIYKKTNLTVEVC